jgi:ABC-type transport system involved in cytochrome bd biosynthesis fused ATPase/permease subunit
VARALLADRPVLHLDEPTRHLDEPTRHLDEPTRHLDAATADAVLRAVLARAAGRSLLWITHRPTELAVFPEVCRLPAGSR